MARGAVRGAMSAAFGLVVLQVVTTHSGSSKVAGAFDIANSLIKRAMDPNVAAIPDFASNRAPAEQAPGVDGYAGSSYEAVPPNPNRIPLPGAPAVPYY